MALDIMQTLVELLCPTYSAQSACNTYINAPAHQVLDPFGPLLYFLFFPTVFLILFIFVGSRAIFTGHKGINLLIGVAVYIFIIINGWYPIILWLGELWFVVLPVLFIFYLFTRRHTGGGSSGGGMSGVGGGVATRGGHWLKESILGERPLDPREWPRQRKLFGDKIKILDDQIKEQKDELEQAKGDREKQAIRANITLLQTQRKEFEIKKKRIGG
jgi:hypothetical protein